MLDCGKAERELLSRLATPARNRYYYGKLLDSYHLELEQRYGNNKRWLINRLTLGTGVLCGLDVVSDAGGKLIRVTAGVAVDGVGREIIVPEDSPPIDPRQPTDDCGRPDGDSVQDGAVTIYLCYHECEAEPAPVLVSECGPERMCENGLVRERYRLRVGRGAVQPPAGLSPEQCVKIFGVPPQLPQTRREVICETVGAACEPADETCVALAVIRFDPTGGIGEIQRCAVRRTIYSNSTLLDLILCLADRVDKCCGGDNPPPPVDVKAIEIVSGDDQAGVAGELAGQPLVARVMAAGNPVANENVTFEPDATDGEVGGSPGALGPDFQIATDINGLAALPSWRFGTHAGLQHVKASIATGAPASVAFTAHIEKVAAELPVVRAIWPPNGVLLSNDVNDQMVRQWAKVMGDRPHIEITFDRKMDAAALDDPKSWLHVFVLRRSISQVGAQVTTARRVDIVHAGPANQPMLGVAGDTQLFDLKEIGPGELRDAKWVILMRSENDTIVDTNTPPLQLDADFHGTKLTSQHLDVLWPIDGITGIDANLFAAIVTSGSTLPQSGDGTEGGRFDSFFTVMGVG